MVMANPQASSSSQANLPEADELLPCEAKHVGREFVRQYYTLLHEAPQFLHRFYSHKSCFVHGGVDKPGEENLPVCGQQEIHQKIMSLNFRDCHAKIRQVDSHPTLGYGVVVQVSGELSNNGEAMRRFMQTFVLAPKCAKRYFVLNDIFRYQDEVFPDEEEADADDTEAAEESTGGNGSPPEAAQGMQENKMYFEREGEVLSNGTIQEEEVEVDNSVMDVPKEDEALEAEIDNLDIDGETEPLEKEPEEPEPLQETKQEPEIVEAPKTCSWAAMASKNTSSAGVGQTAASSGAPSAPAKPIRPVVEPKPAESAPQGSNSPGGPATPRGPRVPREGRFERDRSNTSRGDEGEGDAFGGRRTGGGGGGIGAKYPDSHQLFVGNLPHNISESELKVFFERWGKVVELRINTKSSGGKLPNFGFVVFDSPGPVQEVLQDKPIKFNGEHRLNVEEKKPRGSEGRPMGRGGPRGGGPRGGFSNRGGMKNGSYGRGDGERRGMGPNSRGGMSGAPRR